MGQVFNLANLQFDIPNQYAATILSFEFGVGSYREYIPASSTTLQFNLGFLTDPNNQANLLYCQIYDKLTGSSSQIWNYLDISVAGSLSLYLKQDLTAPNQFTYIMKCLNAQTPGPLQSLLGFTAKWIEKTGTVTVQSATPLSYANLMTSIYAQNSVIVGGTVAYVPPLILSKSMNSPGYGATYTIGMENGALRILYTFRLYVRFHTSIAPKLNRLGIVTCLLNGRRCYCQVQDRTVKIWPSLNIQPYTNFTLTISQVEQPSLRLNNWPLNAYVWVGIDTDDNLVNGIYFSSYTSNQDTIPYPDPVTSIQMQLMELSGQLIRTEQTHTISVYLASGTMTTGNRIFVEFPQFYIESLSQCTNNSLYNFTQITCVLTRQNDTMAVNYASECDVVSGSLIRVILLQDAMNNFPQLYTLTMAFVPLPFTQVPPVPLNIFKLIVHVTGPLELKVKFSTALYTSTLLSLTAEAASEVYWNGSYFNYDRSETLSLLPPVLQGSQGIYIWQGIFKTLVQLTPQQYNDTSMMSIYDSTFGFQFPPSIQTNFLTTYPSDLTADSGDSCSQFLIAALPNLQPGYYTFPVLKIAGGPDYVNTLPYINLFVVNQQCQLQTSKLMYTIPIGGLSEPIIINMQECFPTQDLRISMIDIYNQSNGLVSVLQDPQSLVYAPLSTVTV